MTKRIPGMPGPLAHILCFVLALVLTLVLCLACLSSQAVPLVVDEAFHLRISQHDEIIQRQYEMIGKQVDALSLEVPFEPKTVMDFVTPQALKDYNAQVTAWWMGLLGPSYSYDCPTFSAEGMLEAVREDETFLAGTPTAQQTATARDQIVGTVNEWVTHTVVPLRLSLVSLGLRQVLPTLEVQRYVPYLPYLPWALLGISLVLGGLMALCAHKRVVKAVAYMGSAAVAAALLLGGLCLTVFLLDIPGLLLEYNVFLGEQARLLLLALFPSFLVKILVLLVAGCMLIGVHQYKMRQLMLRLDAREGVSP